MNFRISVMTTLLIIMLRVTIHYSLSSTSLMLRRLRFDLRLRRLVIFLFRLGYFLKYTKPWKLRIRDIELTKVWLFYV